MARFSSTPPISVLWAIPGAFSLSATGSPSSSAARAAASAVRARRSSTTGMPAAARMALASRSLTAPSGIAGTPAGSAGGALGRPRAKLAPKPMSTAVAATARQGSSNTR